MAKGQHLQDNQLELWEVCRRAIADLDNHIVYGATQPFHLLDGFKKAILLGGVGNTTT